MYSILFELNVLQTYIEYFEYKKSHSYMSDNEISSWESFINEQTYQAYTQDILDGIYSFDYPEKNITRVLSDTECQTTYEYTSSESKILEVIEYLIRKCIYKQSHIYINYNYKVQSDLKNILSQYDLSNMYCCKFTLNDYMNNIDRSKLTDIITNEFEDKLLTKFLINHITDSKVYYDGELITETNGIKKNTPLSELFAELYLASLDDYIEEYNIPYVRSMNEIIIFADDARTIATYSCCVSEYLDHYIDGNYRIDNIILPSDSWEFAGITYSNGDIDISDTIKSKIISRIRIKARSLHRSKCRRNIEDDKTIKAFTKTLNEILYEKEDNNYLALAKWAFPLITVDNSIKDIDSYMQKYIKYAVTGSCSPADNRVDYIIMRECGYKSLFNAYYNYLDYELRNIL